MMKKKKPILILLGIILLILLVLFFVLSRRPAQESEEEQSRVRRFFNFGARTTQQETGNESAGGDLLNGGINPLTGREYTDEELRLLRAEQERTNRQQSTTFTGQQPIDPFNPNNQGGGTGTGGGGTGGTGGTGTGGGSGTGTGTGGGFTGIGDFGDDDNDNNPENPNNPQPPVFPPPPSNPSGPACTDIDLYITFTEEEQRQIAQLQLRFNAIAENIVSDQDVQTEENNYNTFVLRTERYAELEQLCRANIAKAPAGNVFAASRVPTPYWTGSDAKNSFIASSLQRTRERVSCGDGFETGPLANIVCQRNIYTFPAIDPLYEKQDTDTWGIPFNWFEIFYRIYIW